MKRDSEKPTAASSESPMGAAPCNAPPTQTAPAGALSKGLRWVLERSSEPQDSDVTFRIAILERASVPSK